MLKFFSNTITKNDFVIPAKLTARTDPKKTPTYKESDFSKLRAAGLFLPSPCAEVFKIEMTSLPECFKKNVSYIVF